MNATTKDAVKKMLATYGRNIARLEDAAGEARHQGNDSVAEILASQARMLKAAAAGDIREASQWSQRIGCCLARLA